MSRKFCCPRFVFRKGGMGGRGAGISLGLVKGRFCSGFPGRLMVLMRLLEAVVISVLV